MAGRIPRESRERGILPGVGRVNGSGAVRAQLPLCSGVPGGFMTEVSAESTLRPGDGPSLQRNRVPLLQGVPLGGPLTGHTGRVVWGAWGVVDGWPVLA